MLSFYSSENQRLKSPAKSTEHNSPKELDQSSSKRSQRQINNIKDVTKQENESKRKFITLQIINKSSFTLKLLVKKRSKE